MPPLLCIANWKANLTPEAETVLARTIQGIMQQSPADNVEIVLTPTFVSLYEIGYEIDHPIVLAGQDCYWEEVGAATGEVSPVALAHLGCKYVLIGHSERRIIFAETNEMVAKKYAVLLKTQKKLGLVPIVCVGETLMERKNGKTREILEVQLSALMKAMPFNKNFQIVIAYEPVWAISTNQHGARKNCDPSDCKEAIGMIKDILHTHSINAVNAIPLVYGGSVDEHNASSYITQGDVSGVLVGSASLHAKRFCAIVHSLNTSI
ncbi:MAG: triose-phosphate isomerase [bacterium]|nr:triose-phosphate isomerase [bacterium]